MKEFSEFKESLCGRKESTKLSIFSPPLYKVKHEEFIEHPYVIMGTTRLGHETIWLLVSESEKEKMLNRFIHYHGAGVLLKVEGVLQGTPKLVTNVEELNGFHTEYPYTDPYHR